MQDTFVSLSEQPYKLTIKVTTFFCRETYETSGSPFQHNCDKRTWTLREPRKLTFYVVEKMRTPSRQKIRTSVTLLVNIFHFCKAYIML